MSTHTEDAPSVAIPAPPAQAVLLTVVADGLVRYLLATDAASIPDALPADTDSASLTVIDLGRFDANAQLTIGAWTDSGWFTLDQVLAAVPLNRAARRRQQREVGQ